MSTPEHGSRFGMEGMKKHSQRALAAPKIINGKIEKIVVVESGAGYINPVAKVRVLLRDMVTMMME